MKGANLSAGDVGVVWEACLSWSPDAPRQVLQASKWEFQVMVEPRNLELKVEKHWLESLGQWLINFLCDDMSDGWCSYTQPSVGRASILHGRK